MTVLFDPERYRSSGMLYLYECGAYPPNYPVPAIRTKCVYDFSYFRPGKVIGLELWCQQPVMPGWDAVLAEYWSRD